MGAWETMGQISFAKLDPATWEPAGIFAVPGKGKRKYPSLAQGADGTVLLAWGDGTGWNRGGDVAWQVFDSAGRVIEGEAGRKADLATWSFPVAMARPDGSFLIIY